MKIRDTDEQIEATNVNMANSVFDDINFADTTFTNINLTNVRFKDVNLTGVTIDEANLTGMRIYGILVTDLLAAHKAAK
jgi:uncharacterized protein YjbI with pentapeptide repeats